MVQAGSSTRRESQNGHTQADGERRRASGRKRALEEDYEPQDPEQKRLIGMRYREMQERVEEMRSDLSNLTPSELVVHMKSQNEAFKKVRDTGIATMDARLINQTADTAMALARKMKVDNASFDTDEFLSRIKVHLGPMNDDEGMDGSDADDDELDESAESEVARTQRLRARTARSGALGRWESIGWMAAKYSRRVMGMEIMYGPLAVQHEKRKVVPRARRRSLPPEVQPTTVVAERATVKDDVPTHVVMAQMRKIDPRAEGINFFRLVVNPESFGQSVENVFYTSFLIREQRAAVRIEDDGEIIITWQDIDGAADNADTLPTFQVVLELDMETWKEAIRVFDIKKPLIPHRTYEQPASLGPNKWYS